MKTKERCEVLTEAGLIEELVDLLKKDSSDRCAAETLMRLIHCGEVDPQVGLRAYRAAIRLVYFPKQ